MTKRNQIVSKNPISLFENFQKEFILARKRAQ
jgi:hypothetical protein